MEWLNALLERVTDLFRWWAVIAPWERGLRIRAGKHVTVFGAGMHFRIPIVDRFYIQSVRLRTVDTQPQTVTTRDGHALTFSGVIQYTVTDLLTLYQTLYQPDDTIVDIASALASQYVSERERDAVSPVGLGAFVSANMHLDDYGLSSSEFRIVDFAFVRTYRLLSAQRFRQMSGVMTMHEYDA